jgi:hypothetical protein
VTTTTNPQAAVNSAAPERSSCVMPGD